MFAVGQDPHERSIARKPLQIDTSFEQRLEVVKHQQTALRPQQLKEEFQARGLSIRW
jgi:hypothetical protein